MFASQALSGVFYSVSQSINQLMLSQGCSLFMLLVEDEWTLPRRHLPLVLGLRSHQHCSSSAHDDAYNSFTYSDAAGT